MLLRELDYARPGSVEEAVQLLAAREDARALAGGQSLVNVMKTRVAAPELVVDLNADRRAARDPERRRRARRSAR